MLQAVNHIFLERYTVTVGLRTINPELCNRLRNLSSAELKRTRLEASILEGLQALGRPTWSLCDLNT